MYAAGIDLGGTYTKVAVISKRGKMAGGTHFETQKFKKFDSWVEKSVSVIKNLLKENSIAGKDFVGVGIGAPGHIDHKKGIIHTLVNIKGWDNVHLAKEFKKRMGKPVYVDNDANMMALGEYAYGAAKGARNAICITLGTGVGGGLILENKLYHGSFMAGGEIGHMPVNVEGPACACGGKACVESYVGNSYIVKRTVEYLKRHDKSILARWFKGKYHQITPLDIANAAKSGDALAKQIWDETGEYLGICLAGVVNLLDPEIVVVGGGVAKAGGLIFKPVRKTLKERVMQIYSQRVKVVPAKLGNDGGLMGCAWQVFKHGKA